MSNTNKKQTFLGGAAVLALATAIVKVLGFLYKIPLSNIIGDDGYGYFNTAYDIYSVLLMVSTTGLPVAMSRMISEAQTLGRTKQIHQIYRVSRAVFLGIGLVGALGMGLLCKQLASWMNSEKSWFAILCLSPAVLFIGIISSERGFFQGQGNMVPTSVSQVMEALCKLVVGLGLAYVVMSVAVKNGLVTELPENLPETDPRVAALTLAHSKAAGYSILGVTLGTVAASAYLVWKRRKASAALLEECRDDTVYSWRTTVKQLLTIGVPITLGAAGLQIITTIDIGVYMGQLKGPAGFDETTADRLKGVYNFAQTVFNMPCAFITPLTVAAIPAITEQLTLRRTRRANTVAESATRVMSLIAMPCSIGLVVLGEPIMQLLKGYSGETLRVAGTLMSILGFCVFFNAFVLVMNAIMQAHGYVYIPVINMVIGGVAKVLINFILVGNPKIHIVGVPVGTLICYMLIAVLDIVAIRRILRNPPRLIPNVLKPALASVVMGAAAFLLNKLCLLIGLPLVLRAGFSILGAAAVYAVMVLLLKVVTKDDCTLLPKGDKIARLLRIE
ncbi:MAG: polysaccharide biosynthesis protein [Oscillospiraceae bacterium]|nr:polysaccharide biosynthesis protein [Oscillospiraceae bacterium]